MNPEEDPLNSIYNDLYALHKEANHVRNIRVKFEFNGERRVVQMPRPLNYLNLYNTVLQIYQRNLMMVYSAGGSRDMCQILLNTQSDLDNVVNLMDNNKNMRNLKLSLVEKVLPGNQEMTVNNNPMAPSMVTSTSVPSFLNKSSFTEPSPPPHNNKYQRRQTLDSSPMITRTRYSPPPGTIHKDEVKRHRGSRTSLNSEGEFIPDVQQFGSSAIGYSSSTSIESSLPSPQVGSESFLPSSYPEEMEVSYPHISSNASQKGGTYPRRLHPPNQVPIEERRSENSRTFPRQRPSVQNTRFNPSSSYFPNNNMSSNCSSCSSGLDYDDRSPRHQSIRNWQSRSTNDVNKQDDNRMVTSPITRKYGKSAPTNWRKGKMLGSGAFGKVYLAYDADTGRELAVKQVELNNDNTQLVTKEIKALKTEIEVLQDLDNDRIVKYYGCCEDNLQLSIFMEYMPGGSIKDELRAYGPITEGVARKYTSQILEGLVYLHSYHYVHRDIKGANVLRDSSGNVKLGDFGAAKRLQTLVINSNQTLIGTPYWMCPEVIEGNGYGRRADIWSLGCTVVEMLTTKPPWYNLEPMAALFKIATDKTKPNLPDHISMECRDFLSLVFVHKDDRPYANQMINHKWFNNGNYF